MAIIFLVFNLFLIVAPFIKPQKESFSTLTIKWFVFPTVGTGLFFAGGLYWFLLRFVWAKLIYKRELQQTRIPILLDGVQVHEIVIFSWVSTSGGCLGGEQMTDCYVQVVPGSQEQSYFETQDGCEYENGSWGNESR